MKISSYVLTYNSERYLNEILEKLSLFSDEVLVVDSGSTDHTQEIVERFDNVVFVVHPFVNFRDQREFAASQCKNDVVFFVDSDEIPQDDLVEAMLRLKAEKEIEDVACRVRRQWMVMGKKIHCIYPIESPDHPVRLYNRKYASFKSSSDVHETLGGFSECMLLEGDLLHLTFHSKAELESKLDLYTTLAANDLLKKQKKMLRFKCLVDPFSAFFKWYFLKKGFLDGRLGLYLGAYAFRYTKMKYSKTLALKKRIFCLAMPLAVIALAFAGCRNGNKINEQVHVSEVVADTISEAVPQKVISTIDFNAMGMDTMTNFKGGENDIYMKMLVDGKNKFMYCTIPSGSSVGGHTHDTDMEIVYVLQGEATVLVDGVEQVYTKGMAHYCQKGHGHSISNKGEEDLVTFNVVAPQ